MNLIAKSNALNENVNSTIQQPSAQQISLSVSTNSTSLSLSTPSASSSPSSSSSSASSSSASSPSAHSSSPPLSIDINKTQKLNRINKRHSNTNKLNDNSSHTKSNFDTPAKLFKCYDPIGAEIRKLENN